MKLRFEKDTGASLTVYLENDLGREEIVGVIEPIMGHFKWGFFPSVEKGWPAWLNRQWFDVTQRDLKASLRSQLRRHSNG
jgi:hypothetical protein